MMPKILLVDDDPLIHLLYKTPIERAGYQLIAAKDGLEALAAAEREQPQVVIMDIIMNDMDGLSALRELKRNEATKPVPVVIITANVVAHHAARKEAEAAGAALFLTKPFSPAQLLDAIRKVAPGLDSQKPQ
jgi:CheY-like chemotaxis protein